MINYYSRLFFLTLTDYKDGKIDENECAKGLLGVPRASDSLREVMCALAIAVVKVIKDEKETDNG